MARGERVMKVITHLNKDTCYGYSCTIQSRLRCVMVTTIHVFIDFTQCDLTHVL